MIQAVYTFFCGTLRGRLILGVVAVQTVVMTLFIIDLTTRERSMLLDRQTEEAETLALSLSTSSAGWVAAADIAGLQEIVDAQRQYPELVFAIITDNHGHVLAHTARDRRGFYLLDLPGQTKLTMITRSPDLVDVAVPVILGGQHVGWARVGIGQKEYGETLAMITRSGIVYAVMAILFGSFIAWFMGYRITTRLYAVQRTIDAVRSGDRLARSQVTGSDEAAVMAREFNAMLDVLDKRDEELLASERALRVASSYNRRLIEASLDPMVTIGPGGKITDLNAATETATGCSREELVGRDFSECFTEPEKAKAGYEKAFREGMVRNYPLELRHRDGRVTPVLYNSAVYRDEGGKVIGVFAAARDISERKRAEEKLRHLASIVESSDDAIIGKTLDELIVSWNNGAERIYGYAAAEIVGSAVSILVPAGLDKELEEIMTRIRRGESVEHFETTRRRKDGRIIHVALTISPIRDDHGQIIGASTIARDITERKHLINRERMRVSVLDMLTQGAPLPDILDAIVRGMEEESPAALVSILLLDRSRQRLQHGAAPSLPQYYNDAIHGLEIGPDVGSCGVAASSGKRVIVEDISTHPSWAAYRDLAARAGLAACWSEPILNRNGRVLGTLAIYRKEPCAPCAKDLELIESVASLAGVVIEHKETQEEIRQLNIELEQRVRDRTRELAESEERFRNIYDTAPVSIWQEDWSDVVDALNSLRAAGVTDFPAYFREHPEFVTRTLNAVKILDVNQCTISMFAANNKAELLASLGTVFATEDTLPGFVSELLALAQGESVFRTEMKLNKVTGELIHTLLVMSFPPPDSVLGSVLVSVIDITERKLAEQALQKSEERMRLFFERQLFGMAITSREKGWVEVNDKICEMLGYSRDELMRMTWVELTFPEDLARDEEQFERLLKGEIEGYTLEKRFIRKDGGIVFTNLAVGCVRRPDRSVDYALALLEDITGRKQADDQILRLNEQLAARAQSLELANKELESFSYSVSHDLRAPLRAIDGFSRIVLEDCADQLDAEGRENLERVRTASQRMGHLIDDMLQLSRLSLSEMRWVPVDLSALARTLADDLQRMDPARHVEFVIEPRLTAMADSNLIRVVLENLLGNAWKFTGKRTEAKIEFGRITGEAGPAFFVRDNGVGFDMAFAHKLFGAFQRLHTTAEFPGTGIGLATVQRVIRRHSGRVWAESKVGQGTTFYFTLATESKLIADNENKI